MILQKSPLSLHNIFFFENPYQWEEWLSKHYDQQEGVWLKFAKKASGITSLNYDGALDVALCYGWIDGLVNKFDETYYLQKFTPRRPKSTWSKRNIGKIAELTKLHKMHAPGIAAVEAAKKDGRWEMAYDSPSTMTMPSDFKSALSNNPKAKKFFETLNKTNVYAVLWRIQTAKKPETRKARIERLIQMLSEEKKLHP